ncbi:MAG: DUF2306 domain-containing protein [Aliishimia sp.]
MNHPAWDAAFYDRFANGPEFRSTLLTCHIILNSLAFVLMLVQLYRPGYGATRRTHVLIGRVTFLFLTISLICAVWLASEHGSLAEYGGRLSQYGFYSMATFVYGCAIMGALTARAKKPAAHRIWMLRFMGAMWGSFWLFRVVLFVIDPFLREVQAAAILIVNWGSAPAGILIADLIRRRIIRPTSTTASLATAAE